MPRNTISSSRSDGVSSPIDTLISFGNISSSILVRYVLIVSRSFDVFIYHLRKTLRYNSYNPCIVGISLLRNL